MDRKATHPVESMKARTRASKKAVLWAIDPFEKETRPDPLMVQRLINWVRASGFELQPIHILSIFKCAPESFVENGGSGRYITASEKASEIYLRELGVTGTRPVKVLIDESATRRNEALALLDYAETQDSPCIVISSHGRSGLQRLVLGSFAENLLLESKKPLMFLTHFNQTGTLEKGEKTIKHALFATDFSDYSREAFLLFLKEAQKLKLELTLFHSVFLPPSALASGYGEPLAIPEDYFPNQLKWTSREAELWAQLAESHGVHTRTVVKDDGVGPHTGQEILDVAKEEGAGLIVMASVSGRLASFILGGVSREVFRANQYPVWIYGPKALRKEAHVSHPHHAASARQES